MIFHEDNVTSLDTFTSSFLFCIPFSFSFIYFTRIMPLVAAFFCFSFFFLLQRENMKTFSKLDALRIDTFLILNAVKEAFE
jgi:hypothetical protein